jgi:hypothetical protein
MTTIAALLMCLLTQDGTTPTPNTLTDQELGVLGGFAAEQVDAASEPAALEKSILEKIEEIRKARSSGEKKDEAPASTRKAKKAERKAEKQKQKQQKNGASDTIKNGLIESDRLALGKFITSEISSDHKGEAFVGAVKTELERLRAERVKSSSTSEPKKKKKKT